MTPCDPLRVICSRRLVLWTCWRASNSIFGCLTAYSGVVIHPKTITRRGIYHMRSPEGAYTTGRRDHPKGRTMYAITRRVKFPSDLAIHARLPIAIHQRDHPQGRRLTSDLAIHAQTANSDPSARSPAGASTHLGLSDPCPDCQ